jgi:HEAT repeat protein
MKLLILLAVVAMAGNEAPAPLADGPHAELLQALRNPDDAVQSAAILESGRLRLKPAVQSLQDLLASRSPRIRLLATVALGAIRDARTADAIAGQLDDNNARVRAAAVLALVPVYQPRFSDELLAGLADEDALVRAATIRAIRRLVMPAQFRSLYRLAKADSDPYVRWLALKTAAEMFGRRTATLLVDRLRTDSSPLVRYEAVRRLRQMPSPRYLPILKKRAFEDDDIDVRAICLSELVRLKGRPMARALVVELIRQGLTESPDQPPSPSRIKHTATLLGALGRGSIPTLEKALQEDNPAIQEAAIRAMGQIGQYRDIQTIRPFTKSANPRLQTASRLAVKQIMRRHRSR